MYPRELRDEVVRVALNRRAGVTIEQIARGFGVHPMTLQEWLRKARTGEDAPAAEPRIESAALHEARKRIRVLEQENEVLRQAAAYLSQANLLSNGASRSLRP